MLKNKKGQAILETALILPILAFLTIFVYDFVIVQIAKWDVATVSRDTVRKGMLTKVKDNPVKEMCKYQLSALQMQGSAETATSKGLYYMNNAYNCDTDIKNDEIVYNQVKTPSGGSMTGSMIYEKNVKGTGVQGEIQSNPIFVRTCVDVKITFPYAFNKVFPVWGDQLKQDNTVTVCHQAIAQRTLKTGN